MFLTAQQKLVLLGSIGSNVLRSNVNINYDVLFINVCFFVDIYTSGMIPVKLNNNTYFLAYSMVQSPS